MKQQKRNESINLWRVRIMNKEEFLSELAAGLSNLNEQERQRVLDYYRELIDRKSVV